MATAAGITDAVHLYSALDRAQWVSNDLVDLIERPVVQTLPTIIANAVRNEAAAANPKIFETYHMAHSGGTYVQMLANLAFEPGDIVRAKFLELAPLIHPMLMEAIIEAKLRSAGLISITRPGIDPIEEMADAFATLLSNGTFAKTPIDLRVPGQSHSAKLIIEQVVKMARDGSLTKFIEDYHSQRIRQVTRFYDSGLNYSEKITEIRWTSQDAIRDPNIIENAFRHLMRDDADLPGDPDGEWAKADLSKLATPAAYKDQDPFGPANQRDKPKQGDSSKKDEDDDPGRKKDPPKAPTDLP
jgi:hypothetical protein